MKAVMISIRPEWCEKIANGEKTVEVRKTRPKLEPPFKCYIYCTNRGKGLWYMDERTTNQEKKNGTVIGEFVCERIEDYSKWEHDIPALYRHINLFARIDYPELYEYLPKGGGYGWHISDLVIYDEPMSLNEFLILDKNAVGRCPYRERTGQPESHTKHNGWIKGSYLCLIDGETWCYPCHTKNLERAPQSWCYVEGTSK